MQKQQRVPAMSLGDLVSAAFDNARAVAPDSRTAAQLAAQAVARRLARSRRLDVAKRLQKTDRAA
jgi:hypothetical protein